MALVLNRNWHIYRGFLDLSIVYEIFGLTEEPKIKF